MKVSKSFAAFGVFILLMPFLEAGEAGPWEFWKKGVQLAEEDRTEEAREAFSAAAVGWEVSSRGPGDFYNAGTAWALADNPAQAVVNFHRALKMDPFHGDAGFNLKSLRKKQQLAEPVWDPGWKVWILWGVLTAGSLTTATGLFLAALKVRHRRKGDKVWRPGVLLVLAGGIIWGALGLALDQRGLMAVVSSPVEPRLGDGEFFEQLEGGPWKPGQEVLILEERQDWIRVRTPDRDGWIPGGFLLRP